MRNRWSVPLTRVWYGTMIVLGAALLLRDPPPIWVVAVTLVVAGWLGYPRTNDDGER